MARLFLVDFLWFDIKRLTSSDGHDVKIFNMQLHLYAYPIQVSLTPPAILSICYIYLCLISRLVWNASHICGSSSVARLDHPEYWSKPQPFTEIWALLAFRDFICPCYIFKSALDKPQDPVILSTITNVSNQLACNGDKLRLSSWRKQYLKLIHWIYFHCEG